MTTPARTPLLVVADDDPAECGLIREELERRYGSDYALRVCTTAELASVLDQAEADGDDVALALASGKEGADLLARLRGRFPTARRGLLIPCLGRSRRGVGERHRWGVTVAGDRPVRDAEARQARAELVRAGRACVGDDDCARRPLTAQALLFLQQLADRQV